jgi:hypothetical protein
MKHHFGKEKKRSPERNAGAPAASTPPASGPTSRVSRSTRRQVLERDGLRCSFRAENGVQCDARTWLEDDHIHPRARGGSNETDNIRFLCRAHNQWQAERTYGRAHMDNAIQRARTRRTRATADAHKQTTPARSCPSTITLRSEGMQQDDPMQVDQQQEGSSSAHPRPPG